MPRSSAPRETDATTAGTAVARSHNGLFLARKLSRLNRLANLTTTAAAVALASTGAAGFVARDRARAARSGAGRRREAASATTRRTMARAPESSASPTADAE